jgi:hypothetical protein
MVGLLAFSVVDHGFISGVMVGLLAFSVVDQIMILNTLIYLEFHFSDRS